MMTQTHQFDGALAAVLKKNRESFNRKFHLAQRAGGRIDRGEFLEFLATNLNSLIARVAEQFAEKAESAAVALYELSLESFAQGLLGRESREPLIADVWRSLLPASPRLLARNPRFIAASVTNAVLQICHTAGARPTEWILTMIAVAPLCETPQVFLEAGKVAAWVAGCPQYRQPALEFARSLPLPVSTMLLSLDPQIPSSTMQKTLDTLSANRWMTASAAAANSTRIRMTGQVGRFRGFGGAFIRPPIVKAQGSNLLATDGQLVFTLIADAYGTILRRVDAATFVPEKLNAPFKLSLEGDLIWDDVTVKLPELAGWSSAAFDGQTLAVSLPTSHHLFLVARG